MVENNLSSIKRNQSDINKGAVPDIGSSNLDFSLSQEEIKEPTSKVKTYAGKGAKRSR